MREETLREIFLLDAELKKAMTNHGRLLADCMELQVKADEIIHKYKYSRLRNAFDFRGFLEKAKAADDASVLSQLVLPLVKPHTDKYFRLGQVEDLLTAQAKQDEVAEAAAKGEEIEYRFEDEIEEERIEGNYQAILKTLLDTLLGKQEFELQEFNRVLETKYFDSVFRNSDYYSFLVHLCQKKEYDLSELRKKQDTFLEKTMAALVSEEKGRRYRGLRFRLELLSDFDEQEEEQILHRVTLPDGTYEFCTSNIRFVRMD